MHFAGVGVNNERFLRRLTSRILAMQQGDSDRSSTLHLTTRGASPRSLLPGAIQCTLLVPC